MSFSESGGRTEGDLRVNAEKAKYNRRNSIETHIGYGTIEKVDYNTCKVQVRMYIEGKPEGELLRNGEDDNFYHYLLNPISEIHMLHRPLVPGMKCRIHWEGPSGSMPTNKIAIDLLRNKTQSLDKQDYGFNEIETGPSFLFG